jgi:hypothetical protein
MQQGTKLLPPTKMGGSFDEYTWEAHLDIPAKQLPAGFYWLEMSLVYNEWTYLDIGWVDRNLRWNITGGMTWGKWFQDLNRWETTPINSNDPPYKGARPKLSAKNYCFHAGGFVQVPANHPDLQLRIDAEPPSKTGSAADGAQMLLFTVTLVSEDGWEQLPASSGEFAVEADDWEAV